MAGLRVIELASLVSGPYCGKLLADAGAEVIKVEVGPAGDESRAMGPFPDDVPNSEHSLLFHYLNVNKKGITLNPATPSGRDFLRTLVQASDVLIEDSKPGYLEALGLGYDRLSEARPELVMLSITPFGQTGPHRDWKAYDLNTTHIGGEGWLTPPGLSQRLFPDREPLKLGGHTGDYYSGVTGAAAVMMALFARIQNSGCGQHIDLSKQEAHLTLVRIALSLWANQGVLETRVTRDIEYSGCVRCKDGFVEINVVLGDHWKSLVAMMGHPDWAGDERFKDHAARSQHGPEINRLLEKWASEHTRQQIFDMALQFGVPVGPFRSPREILESPHERARGFFLPIENSRVPGLKEFPSVPFHFGQTPYGIRRPAPRLGEHNREVFEHLLGLNPEELTQLRRAGVV